MSAEIGTTNHKEIAERYAPDEQSQARSIASPLKRLWTKPILPEAGAAGAPLTAVIGAISFLAALALAAFLMITVAAQQWTDNLKTSFTIQVKGENQAAIDIALTETKRILEGTNGVISFEITAPEDAAKLLEPWLGKGNVSDYLSVPALVDVKANETLRNDLDFLQTRLTAAAPGIIIDDHRAWRDGLASTTRSLQALALAAFLTIIAAAGAIAIFAARAGLAANEGTVALLHLVGATDDFIANEVQRRFVILSLRGSFAGLFLSFLALAIVVLGAKAASSNGFFAPDLYLNIWMALSLLLVPPGVSLVIALTARFTTLKTLGQSY